MLGQLESDGRVVIADMEAGLGILTRMGGSSLDRVLLVANPSPKATEVVRRAQGIIAERKITADVLIIANRLRTGADLERVRAAVGDGEIVAVPEDPDVREADFFGLSPFDSAPDAPAVRAVADLKRWWKLG